MKSIQTFILLITSCQILFLTSCNKIETGDTLTPDEQAYIRSIIKLEANEPIYKFYSTFKFKLAGSFFTDRRVANYWIDKRDTSKKTIETAYYKNIVSIKPNYRPGLTYAPYVMITTKDGAQFKICAEGKDAEVKAFFDELTEVWKKWQ